jgi:hypothetical protein
MFNFNLLKLDIRYIQIVEWLDGLTEVRGESAKVLAKTMECADFSVCFIVWNVIYGKDFYSLECLYGKNLSGSTRRRS